MSVLIWIQTVLHPDGVPERIFRKKLILKKVSRRQQKHEKLPSMQKLDDAYIQATEWKMVPPNEEFYFAFFRRENIRHIVQF